MPRFLSFCILILYAAAFGQSNIRNVVLVIIDGARYSETLGDPQYRFVPRLRQLMSTGAVVDSFINNGVTSTSRAIPAIWTGSWIPPRDTVYNGIATQYTQVPSIWEYYRKFSGADSAKAMYFINAVASPWLQSFHPQWGPAYWPWYHSYGNSDKVVWQNALFYMARYHPSLSVIYLAGTDSYGHTGIWDDYTGAIKTADSITGAVWDFIQADTVYKNKTVLLATNDHGRHEDGVSTGFQGHGDGCGGCRRIMLLAAGANIKKGFLFRQRRIIPDITPTIGAMLGFSTPHASGAVLHELFEPVYAESPEVKPLRYSLSQNYPNPFNPATSIKYAVRSREYGDRKEEFVLLNVYDVLGRRVATLVNEEQPAGWHEVKFDASLLTGGIYFYRLTAGDYAETKKMILMR